jgi:hypothetical protein
MKGRVQKIGYTYFLNTAFGIDRLEQCSDYNVVIILPVKPV